MSELQVPTIASVVEGYGEVTALPGLLRRIAARTVPFINVPTPYRMDKAKMVHGDDFVSAVLISASRVSLRGGVIVLLDGDDDCPVELRQLLEQRLVGVSAAVEIVVANREYEAWFLASVSALSSHSAIQDGASWAGDPDSPRNAKKSMELQMTESYKEALHQPKFSSLIDIDLAASRSRSFRRLVEVVEAMTL